MMQNNYKKSIFMSAFITLIIMIIAFAIFSTIMLLGFTRVSADFVYSLGMNRLAGSLYTREYEKSGDLYYCYKALCVKIKIADNYGIVKTYEKFIADDKSDEFISNIDMKNKQANISTLELSSMLNEGNYLRYKYIAALKNINQEEKAFEYSCADFCNYTTYTFDNAGYYSISLFTDIDGLNTIPTGYTDTIIDCMQDYFDRLYVQFDEHKNTDDKVEKAELIALSYRFMNVGNDINNAYSHMSLVAPNQSSNQDKMIEVNEVIKGLL